MNGVKKSNLPTKICLVCGRVFSWRKKWEKDWANVIYCSERCKAHPKMSLKTKATVEKPDVIL